jgi:hypothetical protein
LGLSHAPLLSPRYSSRARRGWIAKPLSIGISSNIMILNDLHGLTIISRGLTGFQLAPMALDNDWLSSSDFGSSPQDQFAALISRGGLHQLGEDLKLQAIVWPYQLEPFNLNRGSPVRIIVYVAPYCYTEMTLTVSLSLGCCL